jgi:hypothetical protein
MGEMVKDEFAGMCGKKMMEGQATLSILGRIVARAAITVS